MPAPNPDRWRQPLGFVDFLALLTLVSIIGIDVVGLGAFVW